MNLLIQWLFCSYTGLLSCCSVAKPADLPDNARHVKFHARPCQQHDRGWYACNHLTSKSVCTGAAQSSSISPALRAQCGMQALSACPAQLLTKLASGWLPLLLRLAQAERAGMPGPASADSAPEEEQDQQDAGALDKDQRQASGDAIQGVDAEVGQLLRRNLEGGLSNPPGPSSPQDHLAPPSQVPRVQPSRDEDEQVSGAAVVEQGGREEAPPERPWRLGNKYVLTCLGLRVQGVGRGVLDPKP